MITAEPRGEARSRACLSMPALLDLDGLQRAAGAVRRDVLADLPDLLERFADNVLARGGHVCWAGTASDARQYIGGVLVRHGASQVLRSPATGEIGVDQVVAACRADVVETDLDHWIDGFVSEAPHDVAVTAPGRERGRIRERLADYAAAGMSLHRRPSPLVGIARDHLRDQFLSADVGVCKADLAVAATGSVVLLTDGGNTHLTTVLPPVQVVIVAVDRMAAGWDQADLLLTLLGAAASGPRATSTSTSTSTAAACPMTTVISAPRHMLDLDGPRELHVVLLDNGRSRRLARLAGART